ncbi:MAG TPA: TIGR02466 family protein [Sphingomicrobium sp.]
MRKLFPTPVIVDELAGADALNAELERAILAQVSSDSGLQVSNRGGWHSRRDFSDWAGEAGQRLVRHALALADSHTIGRDGSSPPEWHMDAWANVSASGHFNMPHIHGGTFWSAVYYVRAGDGTGGELVLHDPRMPGLQMHAPGVRFRGLGGEGEAPITPKSGLMVLFPGWLAHSVEPWHGEGQRISVAMNIRAKA